VNANGRDLGSRCFRESLGVAVDGLAEDAGERLDCEPLLGLRPDARALHLLL
jgi:hypothetical protein